MRSRGTLLVLGGGREQVGLIRTARGMGLRVACVDHDPDCPGFEIADEWSMISTRDVPSIIGYADGIENLCGIMTLGSDVAVEVARVASTFDHIWHLPVAVAERCRDKVMQRKRLGGVRFSQNTSPRLPAIEKPVTGSGARNVRLISGDIQNGNERLQRERDHLELERLPYMHEEVLEGRQFSTEAIIRNDIGAMVGCLERNYADTERLKPYIIENGGQTADISLYQRELLESATLEAARRIGIGSGIAKCDLIWTEKGIKVIEIHSRLSGGHFATDQQPLETGQNYVEAAILLHMNREVNPAKFRSCEPRRFSAIRHFFFDEHVGKTVEGVAGLAKASKIPGVSLCYTTVKPGDKIGPIECHPDRHGAFVVVSDTREGMYEIIASVYSTVKVVV